jgi:hypothetical protein
MQDRLVSVLAESTGAQQKDNLCGAFWGARVLNESGFSSWDGEPLDQDLVALRAGTGLPAPDTEPCVPSGAVSLATYRYPLPTVPDELSGTSAGALAEVFEPASRGELRCVPLRGAWNAVRVERLVDEARGLGARLIANVQTGPLWATRPPIDVLLTELAGGAVNDPPSDWDVGHFVELEMLIRGPQRSLVVVHDSYPTLGWNGRHVQPPRLLAAGLLRSDGREGGVLAVVPRAFADAARALATDIGLDIGTWNNGSGS